VRTLDGLALRSGKAGDYIVKLSDGTEKKVAVVSDKKTVDLSAEAWNLVIDSYAPTHKDASKMFDERGIQTVDPSATTITTIDFGVQPLINWEELKATSEQLKQMGVESMDQVSGKGYYTLIFDWDGSDAYLSFAYGNDQITGITVNDKEIKTINNMTDQLDLGGLLVAGKNMIEIELTTTLSARAIIESDVLRADGLNFGGTTYKDNGLTSVILTTYSEMPL